MIDVMKVPESENPTPQPGPTAHIHTELLRLYYFHAAASRDQTRPWTMRLWHGGQACEIANKLTRPQPQGFDWQAFCDNARGAKL